MQIHQHHCTDSNAMVNLCVRQETQGEQAAMPADLEANCGSKSLLQPLHACYDPTA